MSDDEKAVKTVHYDAICRHYKEPEEWSVVDSGTGDSYGWSEESEAKAWADARSRLPVAQCKHEWVQGSPDDVVHCDLCGVFQEPVAQGVEVESHARAWHRVVETLLTVSGLSPALGADEALTALNNHLHSLEKRNAGLEKACKDWAASYGRAVANVSEFLEQRDDALKRNAGLERENLRLIGHIGYTEGHLEAARQREQETREKLENALYSIQDKLVGLIVSIPRQPTEAKKEENHAAH